MIELIYMIQMNVAVWSGEGEERMAEEESVGTVYESSLYVNREQSWKLRRYETRLWNL